MKTTVNRIRASEGLKLRRSLNQQWDVATSGFTITIGFHLFFFFILVIFWSLKAPKITEGSEERGKIHKRVKSERRRTGGFDKCESETALRSGAAGREAGGRTDGGRKRKTDGEPKLCRR